MNAVDTNILIYVHDPRDASKQMIAGELVTNLDDGLLLWQTACEFLAASRKLVPYGYSYEQALADIRELMSYWSTAIPTWAVLDRGESLLARYSLSYWDATLIAAGLEAGATSLYSENFTGYRDIDGLKIINPFAATE